MNHECHDVGRTKRQELIISPSRCPLDQFCKAWTLMNIGGVTLGGESKDCSCCRSLEVALMQ